MHPKVKICGMTNAETIQTAIKHKVDYLGFVFYPKSPRNLTPDQARELTKNIPQNVKRIAVLVNAKDEFIEQIKDYFDCIKAIRVTDKASARTFSEFEDEVDMLIFDSPAMEKTAKFDWQILSKLKITKPYLIAGSININNVDEILKYNPTGVDVSAGVESSVGVKSNEKIIEFLDKVKS